MGERGEPGKLCSYWEKRIYVVKEQISDNLIHPEGDPNARNRTIHINLLLVNSLPVERTAQLADSNATPCQRQKQPQWRINSADKDGVKDISYSSAWSDPKETDHDSQKMSRYITDEGNRTDGRILTRWTRDA
ncbi:uncharacterized protein LOC117560224, partial [Tachysurus ichikawai]